MHDTGIVAKCRQYSITLFIFRRMSSGKDEGRQDPGASNKEGVIYEDLDPVTRDPNQAYEQPITLDTVGQDAKDSYEIPDTQGGNKDTEKGTDGDKKEYQELLTVEVQGKYEALKSVAYEELEMSDRL